MANMGQCDRAIYKNGQQVAVIAGVSSRVIEALVQEASEHCGFKMDWHYIGGRAVVLTLGDPQKAGVALRRELEMLPLIQWNCDGEVNPLPSVEQQSRGLNALAPNTFSRT